MTMPTISEYKQILRERGVVEIELDTISDKILIEIASCFGRIVSGARNEIIQNLHARNIGEGPIGSFSYCVGYDAFPWHTDTAYWDIPVRYLLLTSEHPSPCSTLYQSFDELSSSIIDFDNLMSRSIFLLNVAGKKRYLSPSFRDKNGKSGYRLDFHIYRPMNTEAHLLMEKVEDYLSSHCQRVNWTGTKVAIIDNWRIIHSREKAHNDKNRLLKRIYINELD